MKDQRVLVEAEFDSISRIMPTEGKGLRFLSTIYAYFDIRVR